ncbi:MAG: hypothetical protein LBV55_02750 [Acholeplasmatales bacterium]|jgi:hypothetical protein|nr:hypothetical protein [Acholeplasmatales bacterium]
MVIMGKFLDAFHTSYIIISLVLTAGILILAKLFLRQQKSKNIFLLIIGISAYVIHMSLLWYDFLATGQTPVARVYMLFVIYPCNLVMVLGAIIPLIKRKNTKFFQSLCIFTFYVGVVGTLASLFDPSYYFSQGISFDSLKSMISHSLAFLFCLWLLIGGYVKLRLTNIIPYSICLVATIIYAIVVSSIFRLVGADYKNVMYIITPAISGTPLNLWFISALSLVVFSLTGFLAEFFYPKNQRSYLKFMVFEKKNIDGSLVIDNLDNDSKVLNPKS